MFVLLESFDDITTANIEELLGIQNFESESDRIYDNKSYIYINPDGIVSPVLPNSRRIVWGGLIVPSGSSYSLTFRLGRGDTVNVRIDTATNTYTELLTPTYFTVKMSFTDFNASATFSAGSQYTAIDPENTIPGMFYRPFFLEIYVDSTNTINTGGSLKIAINGRNVCSRNNCVTSAYNAWGSEISAPESYFNRLQIVSSGIRIGQMYICNEEMGYHDDFIGPFEISSCVPENVPSDTRNWTPYLDGEPAGNDAHVEAVAKDRFEPYVEGDLDYLEADNEGVRELFYYSIPVLYEQNELEILDVRFRCFCRQIFDAETRFASSIFPVIQPQGRDLISRIQEGMQVESATYFPLGVNYDVYPDLATRWTWLMLLESQFGV
jgi:hypothetical protein